MIFHDLSELHHRKQFDAVKRFYETVAKDRSDRCNLGTAMRGFMVLSTLDGASPINI